ncbi:MAG TPA: hypothetical protein VHS31_06220 [Tepidisphaeraceae bacterium]|jgi:hypothetical protein|nr:hypothetical protein [Tepidisphaeraceae bacterium]
MTNRRADNLRFLIAFATFILIFATTGVAQPASGPPLALTDLAGKTGAFQLTLTDRSPLSSPVAITKRLHLKPEEVGDDYDLSKQVFDVYIPPQSDENGKYGLLTVIVFLDDHGYAPEAWHPILDKYHLIWIGANKNIGEGQPPLHRVGPLLDGIYNAEKTWPIDQRRVYITLNTADKKDCGLGLLYPDVFTGTINALALGWYAKIPDDHTRGIWGTDSTPRPPEPYLTLARSRSFVIASRDEGKDSNNNIQDELVFRKGYQASGFRHSKLIKVPHEDMDHWVNYKGGWLEEGIQFLDENAASAKVIEDAAKPLAAASPPPPPPSAPATQPEPTLFPSSPPPATAPASADDSAAKAASALSVTKSYIAAQKYDLARPRLQKIIDTYPNTPAAKEAKTLLTQIQGK